MRLADIHSHILPEIDDGAKDVATSLELLKMYKEQGVTDIFATPHFIPMRISLEEFLELREKSYKLLIENISDSDSDMPNIHLGGEVFYFSGIGKSESLKELKLGDTDYILIELPIAPIDDGIIKDLTDIKCNLKLTPVIAHIERIYGVKGFKKLLNLIEVGAVKAQVNATELVRGRLAKKAIKLIKKGYISFIATDTHSVHGRPPRMEEALDFLQYKFNSEISNKILRSMDKICKNGK